MCSTRRARLHTSAYTLRKISYSLSSISFRCSSTNSASILRFAASLWLVWIYVLLPGLYPLIFFGNYQSFYVHLLARHEMVPSSHYHFLNQNIYLLSLYIYFPEYQILFPQYRIEFDLAPETHCLLHLLFEMPLEYIYFWLDW